MDTNEKPKEAPKAVNSKKTLYIILAVVAGLFFLCLATIIIVVGLVLPKPKAGPSIESCEKVGLFYDGELNKCVSSLPATPTPTEVITQTPTTTPGERDVIKISKAVDIKFKDDPISSESVSFFVDNYGSDDDGIQDTYMIGEFTSGEISNETTSKKLNLAGKTLYLAIIYNKPAGDLWGAWATHVHFVKIDGTYYLLDNIREYYDPGVKPGINKEFAVIEFDSFEMPTDFYVEGGLVDANDILKSAKGVYYTPYISFWPTLFHNSDMTAVDTLMGATVYMSKSDEYSRTFLKANNGFLYSVSSIPSIMLKDGKYVTSYVAEIAWTNGGTNSSSYTYSSIGTCMENDLEVIKNPPALKKTGVAANGNDIFEAVSNQESYRKNLYEEDYLKGEINKYNTITTDDAVPFTYEQYLNSHPVFYWKDEYGRVATFVNDHFVFSGGCGKPVVYLYPTKTIDATVKVIPNGRLTLTVPLIGKDNVWNVVATKDSQIIDVASGKKYSYLWWESQGALGVQTPKEGFVLANDSLEQDLRKLLESMNMSSSEMDAFCEYWLPIMNEDKSPYYFVTFLFNEQVNQIARLEFSPTPDVVNRVFMIYEPLEREISVKPLAFNPFERNGYFVVEWGGAKR